MNYNCIYTDNSKTATETSTSKSNDMRCEIYIGLVVMLMHNYISNNYHNNYYPFLEAVQSKEEEWYVTLILLHYST